MNTPNNMSEIANVLLDQLEAALQLDRNLAERLLTEALLAFQKLA